MSSLLLPPGLILIAAGFLAIVLKGTARTAVLVIAALGALLLIVSIPEGSYLESQYLGMEHKPFVLDKLSRLFGIIFCIMAALGAIYSHAQNSTLEKSSAFIYAGAALGVVYAGDWLTLFVFWEVMAVASGLVIWAAGESAYKAGQRYFAIHFLGGVLLMAGVAGEVITSGSTTLTTLTPDSTMRWLLLGGILINAAAPPFNAWLTDAYPSASWSGSVFLSAFTTKTTLYVLIRTFPGADILITLGLIMVIYGIVFAVRENDMRRILALAIINQVGFIMVGIGIGSEVAIAGAAGQAFVHILYKGLLFMTAGAVLYQTGRSKLTQLGGLARLMPLVALFAVIGAATTVAFPLTGAFVTKSLILKGAYSEHMTAAWLILVGASTGALLNAGLRYPYFVFFAKSQDDVEVKQALPSSMKIAMAGMAALCVLIGLAPDAFYSLLPYKVKYDAYTLSHILQQLQFLGFGALAFFTLRQFMKPTETSILDTDFFYREFGRPVAQVFNSILSGIWIFLKSLYVGLAKALIGFVYILHGPTGALARSWSTSLMALWAALLLVIYLLFFLL